jgi:predicted transcriptional regulator of viral defense system
MKFVSFKSYFKDFPVFTISDITTVYPNFDRRRLTEWQHKGYIRKIAKGLYIFNDADLDEAMLFRIANKLYRPSYISLETALGYYHFIPEAVYGITSVSTRRTYRFETPVALFSYRTIAPKLFFGYTITDESLMIATPEKTLLDFFYLNSSIDGDTAIDYLRLNREELTNQLHKERLLQQLTRFSSRALTERVFRFLERI